eukprot:3195276-Amphidinium_carterae.2
MWTKAPLYSREALQMIVHLPFDFGNCICTCYKLILDKTGIAPPLWQVFTADAPGDGMYFVYSGSLVYCRDGTPQCVEDR